MAEFSGKRKFGKICEEIWWQEFWVKYSGKKIWQKLVFPDVKIHETL